MPAGTQTPPVKFSGWFIIEFRRKGKPSDHYRPASDNTDLVRSVRAEAERDGPLGTGVTPN